MNLEPFSRINPCGFPGMKVTDLASELLTVKSKRQQLLNNEGNGEHLLISREHLLSPYVSPYVSRIGEEAYSSQALLSEVAERLGQALKIHLTEP